MRGCVGDIRGRGRGAGRGRTRALELLSGVADAAGRAQGLGQRVPDKRANPPRSPRFQPERLSLRCSSSAPAALGRPSALRLPGPSPSAVTFTPHGTPPAGTPGAFAHPCAPAADSGSRPSAHRAPPPGSPHSLPPALGPVQAPGCLLRLPLTSRPPPSPPFPPQHGPQLTRYRCLPYPPLPRGPLNSSCFGAAEKITPRVSPTATCLPRSPGPWVGAFSPRAPFLTPLPPLA